MPTDIRIPQLGESISEGVLARWLKRDGEPVRANETVLEIETDKATMEIPADVAGRLEILEREGAIVKPGAVVARIHEGAPARPAPAGPERDAGPAAEAARPRPDEAEAHAPPSEEARRRPDSPGSAPRTPLPAEAEAPPLSPAVRRLVAEHELDTAAIAATGKGGRLTKEDVLRHVEDRAPGSVAAPAETRAPAPAPGRPVAPGPARATPELPGGAAPATPQEAGAGEPSVAGETERVRMTQLRRRIAERLVEVQRTAAILTTFNEVDMSAVMAVRRQHRERFKARHGVDLGLVSIFARAVVLALADIPIVNAAIEGDEIVYHRSVHLGIAVATPRGLIVPVVRHADRKDLAGLERAIAELAALAREGKVLPDHLSGGTFTITNGGVFGSLLSTPILNPPQSGILGMHKIQDRPVAIDGQVAIRPMMYLALSYDHRLVDGEQAVTFLVRVKERLEDPLRMLLDV
jgi:2-oxoglutarate dehydrogenase E2 component (dihydrolipoamide succinyltransferase)